MNEIRNLSKMLHVRSLICSETNGTHIKANHLASPLTRGTKTKACFNSKRKAHNVMFSRFQECSYKS